MSGRQDWRTPPALFCGLVDLVGVGSRPITDVASNGLNSLGAHHITAADHGGAGALAASAEWGPIAWCNPPYARVMPWVLRGELAASHGTSTLWLVPAAMDTRWCFELLGACDLWWLTRGRVSFLDPDTGEEGGSAPGGHLVAYMTPDSVRRRRGHVHGFCGYLDPVTGDAV